MLKSFDNELQRLTYSDQKKRHFVRPFTVCTTDGRIVAIFGPYFAVNNDASILLDVLERKGVKENEAFRDLLKPGDVFILDRGFRDCVKTLIEKYEF